MSFRAARRLQIAAVVLFALVLLTTLVLYLAQEPAIRLFSNNDERLNGIHVTLTLKIISAVIDLAVAVVYLLMLNRRSSSLRGPVIAIAVLCGLSILLALPAEFVNNLVISRKGAVAFAAYAALKGMLDYIANPMAYIGAMLMFLSMGGAFGKGRSADPLPTADGGETD